MQFEGKTDKEVQDIQQKEFRDVGSIHYVFAPANYNLPQQFSPALQNVYSPLPSGSQAVKDTSTGQNVRVDQSTQYNQLINLDKAISQGQIPKSDYESVKSQILNPLLYDKSAQQQAFDSAVRSSPQIKDLANEQSNAIKGDLFQRQAKALNSQNAILKGNENTNSSMDIGNFSFINKSEQLGSSLPEGVKAPILPDFTNMYKASQFTYGANKGYIPFPSKDIIETPLGNLDFERAKINAGIADSKSILKLSYPSVVGGERFFKAIPSAAEFGLLTFASPFIAASVAAASTPKFLESVGNDISEQGLIGAFMENAPTLGLFALAGETGDIARQPYIENVIKKPNIKFDLGFQTDTGELGIRGEVPKPFSKTILEKNPLAKYAEVPRRSIIEFYNTEPIPKSQNPIKNILSYKYVENPEVVKPRITEDIPFTTRPQIGTRINQKPFVEFEQGNTYFRAEPGRVTRGFVFNEPIYNNLKIGYEPKLTYQPRTYYAGFESEGKKVVVARQGQYFIEIMEKKPKSERTQPKETKKDIKRQETNQGNGLFTILESPKQEAIPILELKQEAKAKQIPNKALQQQRVLQFPEAKPFPSSKSFPLSEKTYPQQKSKELPTVFLFTKSKEEEKLKEEQKNNVLQIPKTKLSSQQSQKPKQSQISLQALQTPLQSPAQIPKQSVSQSVSQSVLQSPAQSVSQSVNQNTNKNQNIPQKPSRQIPDEIEKTKPNKITEIIKIIRNPEKSSLQFPPKSKPTISKKSYQAFIKLKQKKLGKKRYKSLGFIQLNNQPLTKEAAQGLLASALKSSARRSGYIREVNQEPIERPDLENYFRNVGYQFRQGKKNANLLVQKTQFSISSPGEKREISNKKMRFI